MCIWVIVQLRELWLLIKHILLYVTERKPEVQVIYMKYAMFIPSFLHPPVSTSLQHYIFTHRGRVCLFFSRSHIYFSLLSVLPKFVKMRPRQSLVFAVTN